MDAGDGNSWIVVAMTRTEELCCLNRNRPGRRGWVPTEAGHPWAPSLWRWVAAEEGRAEMLCMAESSVRMALGWAEFPGR